LPKFR
jgi:Casein kinase II regulatory subunit